MKVSAQLDELRASLPGCSLVVFGDLFSQITLCVSSQSKHPQEQLDALCVTAGSMLDGPVARIATSAMGMQDHRALAQAVVLGPDYQHIFVRSPIDQEDLLSCVLPPSVDVETAMRSARETLKLITLAQ